MKAIPLTARLLLCSLLGASFSTHANADILAGYAFDSGSVSSTDSEVLSTAGTFGAGSGIAPNYAASNWARVSSDQTGTGNGDNSIGVAIGANEFHSFTLTPQTGNVLNLSSLTFDAAFYGGASGFNASFALRSSVDSFASTIGSIFVAPAQNTSTPTFGSHSIDLSGVVFQGLSSSIEFRIYIFDNTSGNGRYLGLDNVVLNGSLSAVPEPSTYAALSGGVIGLFVALRRKKPQASAPLRTAQK